MLPFIIIALIVVFCIVRFVKTEFITKFVLYCFVGYWAFSLILSCINPYGYYPIQDITYIYLLIGVFSFVVGMVMPKGTLRAEKCLVLHHHLYDDSFNKISSNKVILGVYAIISLYCIPMVINTVAMAAVSGGVAMTDEKMEVVFLNNGFNSLLFQYVMYPLLHLDYALLAFMILKRKTNWLAWIIYLAYLIEFMLMAGGRSILLVAVLYVLIIYFSITPVETIKKISFRRAAGFIVLLVIVMYGVSIMTNYRAEGLLYTGHNNREESVFSETTERIASYSIIPFSLFDNALRNKTCERYQYTLGRASFAGVDVLVNGFMKRIGVPYNTTMDIVYYAQDNYVQIGPDANYNYAYTVFFYHYIDFGVVGLFLFPFVFGLLFRRTIINYYHSPSFSCILLMGVAFFMMIHSNFTCYFIKPWVVPYIIVLLFFQNRRSIVIHN